MRSSFALVVAAGVFLAAPVSAQWMDPYAPLRNMQRAQEVQAQQQQAWAMQEQVNLQRQQLEVQRQQMQEELRQQQEQMQQMAAQQQAVQEQLEATRHQAEEQKLAQQEANENRERAAQRFVPEGVTLKSATILKNGKKRCRFENGQMRLIPAKGDCFLR